MLEYLDPLFFGNHLESMRGIPFHGCIQIDADNPPPEYRLNRYIGNPVTLTVLNIPFERPNFNDKSSIAYYSIKKFLSKYQFT
jgi:hypothetical protein